MDTIVKLIESQVPIVRIITVWIKHQPGDGQMARVGIERKGKVR
jgi:hypothetical protein